VIPVGWEPDARIVSTRASGGFAPGEAVVFVFTPPVGVNSGGQKGRFTTSPSDAAAYNTRLAVLSDTPCDFSGKMGRGSVVASQEPTLYFTVGGYPTNRYGITDTTYPDLKGGVSYYITVIPQHSVGGENSCTSSQCNINYSLMKPTGT
jgi:hypothetical protein